MERYGIDVLGTPVETIMATEDRELFVDKLDEIEVKTIQSHAVTTMEDLSLIHISTPRSMEP